MKPDYVTVPIKLCPEFGNDEYIFLCNLGGRIVSDFKVMEWGLQDLKQKKNKHIKRK